MIGGSLLRALRSSGRECVGADVDPSTRASAAAAGFEVSDISSAVASSDLVVLAMPLPQLADALFSVGQSLRPGTVLTDVGTLKQPVLAEVAAQLPSARFVGGHPLAGTEESGWAAADPALFRDAPWALTLEADTDLDAWLALSELLCELGAHPVPTTAVDQDAAIARVIGLPHVLAEALALAGLAGGPLPLSLAAGSYTSGSRVARTRPELVATWCDGNPALVDVLNEVLERLVATRDALAAGGSILPLARDGHSARTNWERRSLHGVDVLPDRASLLAHGRAGGWITSVHETAHGVRLRGVRPQ